MEKKTINHPEDLSATRLAVAFRIFLPIKSINPEQNTPKTITMSRTQLHSRYQSLEMEPMDDSNDNSSHTWLQENLDSMQLKRSEMNELIMDYLVHEGFKEAAERFREEAGIDLSNFGYSDACSSGITRTNPNSRQHQQQTTRRTSAPRRDVGAGQNDISTAASSSHQSSSSGSSHQIIMDTGKSTTATTDETTTTNELNGSSSNWLTRIETVEMMDKRVEIRHHIEEGDILRAKSLINLHYPELLDNHRDLYFKLQQQHLIELIRQQKINEVLNYVHEQLSVDELGDLTEMEKTLALLAYENPDKSPYANLLKTSHRLQLASEINDIILQDTTGSVEPYKPRLVTLLKLLFWTQNELERKKIQFPKIDLVDGTIVDSRS